MSSKSGGESEKRRISKERSKKIFAFASAFARCEWTFKVNSHRVSAGIEGAFDGAGSKTVIPRKVIGKFSIRLVPDMLPSEVEKLVKTHLEKIHKDRDSPNTLK